LKAAGRRVIKYENLFLGLNLILGRMKQASDTAAVWEANLVEATVMTQPPAWEVVWVVANPAEATVVTGSGGKFRLSPPVCTGPQLIHGFGLRALSSHRHNYHSSCRICISGKG